MFNTYHPYHRYIVVYHTEENDWDSVNHITVDANNKEAVKVLLVHLLTERGGLDRDLAEHITHEEMYYIACVDEADEEIFEKF